MTADYLEAYALMETSGEDLAQCVATFCRSLTPRPAPTDDGQYNYTGPETEWEAVSLSFASAIDRLRTGSGSLEFSWRDVQMRVFVEMTDPTVKAPGVVQFATPGGFRHSTREQDTDELVRADVFADLLEKFAEYTDAQAIIAGLGLSERTAKPVCTLDGLRNGDLPPRLWVYVLAEELITDIDAESEHVRKTRLANGSLFVRVSEHPRDV